jgi:hypothetical protein
MSSSIRRGSSKLALFIALVLCGCGDEGPRYYTEASVEIVQGIKVLRLVGTPFEMGLQHGELMADVLAEGVEFIETDPLFSMFLPLARSLDLTTEAAERSYPDIYDECKGMTEAARRAGTDGWTMEICISLAYGDVVIAFIEEMIGPGCTQFAAAGDATQDGRLVHGRTMDWDDLSYLLNHPTVIVRRPVGRIPNATIGFPGCVAPYNAMNAEGLTLASNDASADPNLDPNVRGRRSHTQMCHQILNTCDTLDKAEEFIKGEEHSRATIFQISDAKNRTSAVFEMTASHMGIRRMNADGLVYVTNHFTHPDMEGRHRPVEPEGSSKSRLKRLDELLPPDGRESLYGLVDAAAGITVLRDRYNPFTGETQEPQVFDNNASIATNGAIWSIVFLPEDRIFYMAAGQIPVPSNAYIGFDLDELLKGPGARQPDPPEYQ